MIANAHKKLANSVAVLFGIWIENHGTRSRAGIEQAADHAGIAAIFDTNAKAHRDEAFGRVRRALIEINADALGRGSV